MPGKLPPTRAQIFPGALTVSLSAARGGHDAFQILARGAPGEELRELRVETGDLAEKSSRRRIPSHNIQWHAAGFVWIPRVHHPHRLARHLAEGWYPDPLLAIPAVDVPPDFTQPLWITVSVPSETRAGMYEGEVLLRARGGEPARIAISLTVFDVLLAPGAGRLRTSFDLIEGFLEKIYGTPVPRKIARRYGEFLLRHRLNPDHFSRSDPPDIDDLRHYRRLGLNSFCVINLAWHRRDSPDPIRGGLNSPPEWYTEAHWDQLARRVEPFIRRLKRERSLWPLAYVHGFDERDIDTHGAAMRLFFGRVRERWDLPTLTTSHIPTDPAILNDLRVDWLCPIWAQYHLSYNLRCATQARAAGHKVWSYISLEPYPPFPNWRLDSPLSEARTLWWQVFHQKMDGFLYWGLNVWNRSGNDRAIDPIRDGTRLNFRIGVTGEYDWLHGDGVLLYPGVDGPIGSMRLANIRDGLEDYELLCQLSEHHGGGSATRACLPVAKGRDCFTHDPAMVLRCRQRMLKSMLRWARLS